MFLITGGGSGIGRALARNLATKKQSVLIIGRTQAALDETAANSPYIQRLAADITTSEGRQAVERTLQNTIKLRGLINNAAISEPIISLRNLDEAGWRAIIETNLTVPFLLTQCLYEKLVGGRTLQINTDIAYDPIAALGPYCISKMAALRLVNCWQLESTDIASTSVLPGVVDTQLQKKARESKHIPVEKRRLFQSWKDNNQLISPETVASFLAWLLLDINKERYVSHEWDIYDTSHHAEWLSEPHRVPILKK